MAQLRLPQTDLQFILEQTVPLWEEMRNSRIFITGGTGFFGRWLLESFLHINQRLGLNAQATVLSRNPAAFAAREPHVVSDPAITLLSGDVTSYDYPEGIFDFVIHAATEVAIVTASNDPLERLSSIQQGTAHTLRFAAARGTRKFLFTSSGAVYGNQPSHITHLPEDYLGAPNTSSPASVYGEGKRVSELMCMLYAPAFGFEIKVARCFAFAGPGLALDSNFAIGNFIDDVIAGRSILIGGDGTPMRSYLYAADLAVWLWTMLFRAPSMEIFNLGSEDAISIADLAYRIVATLDPSTQVVIAKTPIEPQPRLQYVPSTQKAQNILGLRQTVDLDESIRRMARWNGFKEGQVRRFRPAQS
jgi:nucleoside-diphosphate-sugar epimerase